MIGNPYKGKSFKGLIQYLFHGRKGDPNPHRVEWHWVRGHSGHPENDRVDRLACAEADDQRRHHRL